MTTSSAWDALSCSAWHTHTHTAISTKAIPARVWSCFFFWSMLHRKLHRNQCFYLHHPHCCLPVEDESYGCNHDNADTQNDHDHILEVQPWGKKQAHANINNEKNNNEIKVLNNGAIKTSAALDAHTAPPSLGLPSKFSGSSSGRTPPFQYSAGFAATIVVLFCDVSKNTKVSNWKKGKEWDETESI